jgi:hypothetical protein
MVPQGSLNHIAMVSMLQDSITLAQLHVEGIKIIKQKLAQGKEKYKFSYGSAIVLWFPKTSNSKDKFLMKHTFQSSPFIPVAQKCTRILDRIIGGPE